MDAQPLSLVAVVEPEEAQVAPWRWWWLVILAFSVLGWALVIFITLLCGKIF